MHIDLLRCQLPRKYIDEKSPHSLQENIRNNEIVVLYVWAPYKKVVLIFFVENTAHAKLLHFTQEYNEVNIMAN